MSQIVPFKDKIANVRGLLENWRPQLAMALPRHLSVDRMLRVALTSIQKNPKLLECTQHSLLASIMQSAQLGLECDGVLGEAYLVPYKTTVQLIPGYKGLMKLARRSGEISTIMANEVYEKDDFSFSYGVDASLQHVPTSESDPGPILAFYAVSKLKDGGSQFVVLWKRQVDAIMKRSAGYQAAQKYGKETPWDTDYAEMGKKTAIRRLCKYLPSSVELQRAIALDEQAEAGLPQDLDPLPIDVSPESTEAGPKSKLDALVDSDKKPDKPPDPETASKQQDLGAEFHRFCNEKGIPDEALWKQLGAMGIEKESEIKQEHMTELLNWATIWTPSESAKKEPKQKNLMN